MGTIKAELCKIINILEKTYMVNLRGLEVKRSRGLKSEIARPHQSINKKIEKKWEHISQN
jgi:hypothetical protein